MTIQIKYFASLRDLVGRSEDELPSRPGLTAAEIWSRLWPETPLPANTLIAVNMEYQDTNFPVQDGDEVAFFPPITGG